MIQAKLGKVPYEKFSHNKNLMNIYGETVCDILRDKNLQIPKNWNIDPQILDVFKLFY